MADKPLMILHGEIQTPPMSERARVRMGYLLRKLQQGETLSLPDSRPMPRIGARCHELRVKDGRVEWRLVYRTDEDAVIVAEVFKKKTRETPQQMIDVCRERFAHYDASY